MVALVLGRRVKGGREELNCCGGGEERTEGRVDVAKGGLDVTLRMRNSRVQTSGGGRFVVPARSQLYPLVKEEPRSRRRRTKEGDAHQCGGTRPWAQAESGAEA